MTSWNCCRMCLGSDSLHPIFAKTKFSDKYTQIILTTTGIKIESTDLLPQVICKHCIDHINVAHKFRKKCDQNQKILLKKLNEKKTCEIKIETVIVKTEITDNFIDLSEFDNDEMKIDDIRTDEVNNTHSNNADEINNTDEINNIDEINNTDDINNMVENNDFIDNESCNEPKLAVNVEKPIEVRVSKRNPVMHVPKTLTNKRNTGEVRERVKEDVECEYCHKVLTSKLSLRNHYKIHTGFDVVCEHCGKKFITKRLLLMHCRAKHGYEKTDKCSYCDYKASNAEQVKIHERLHTGEKPYVCSSCGAGFHRKSSYLQHVAIHLPDKNVQCDLCHARFKSVTLMRIHRHRHREIRYWFKCRVCSNTFVRRRNVARHLHRIHGLEPTNEHMERVKINQ